MSGINGEPMSPDPREEGSLVPSGRKKPDPEPPDPFDPEALRLSQDFGSMVGVKKILTAVPVRKPNRQEFVRVRPGDEWRIATGILTDQVDRSTYLVDRTLWAELNGDLRPAMLFSAVSKQGSFFLWPVLLPGPDGRVSTWHES